MTWWKKEIKEISASQINSSIQQLQQTYKISAVLSPKSIFDNLKYKIIVWTYLGAFGYIITVEPILEENKDEENDIGN